MAPKNLVLVLLLVVLAASGALLGSGLLGQTGPTQEDEGLAPDELEPATAAQAQAAAPEQPEPALAGGGERVLAEAGAGRIEVVVVDERGRQVAGARVTLEGPGDARLERDGGGVVAGLAPGTWTVRADPADDSLLPGVAQVEVRAGQQRMAVCQLLSGLRVSGRLVDDHGAPRAHTQVWLLPKGSVHPLSEAAAKSMTGATTDRKGQFRLEAGPPGFYRFSVGPPGPVPLWRDPAGRELTPAGPKQALVVIPSQDRMVLRMGEPPAGLSVEGANPVVQLLVRRELQAQRPAEEPRPGAGGRRQDPRRLVDGANPDGRGRGRAGRPGQSGQPGSSGLLEPGTQPPGDSGDSEDSGGEAGEGRRRGQRPATRPEPRVKGPSATGDHGFVRWQQLSLLPGVELPVKAAPRDRDLGLTLIRRGAAFATVPRFRVRPGWTTRVTIPWPPRGAKEGTLTLQVETLPPPEGAPQVGVLWSN